jgi:hypothetical protein
LFDLSYEKKFTADFSWLYPVCHDECVPGDTWKIGCSAVIRFNPLVAPIMHQVTAKVYYFFVPYRILDQNWEEIITGGISGTSSKVPPVWPATAIPGHMDSFSPSYLNHGNGLMNSLWDFLGFPTDVSPASYTNTPIKPLDYPRRAYYNVWVNYFFDENFWTVGNSLMQGQNPNGGWVNDALHFIPDGVWLAPRSGSPSTSLWNAYQLNSLVQQSWARDYFTTSLRSQQRGTQPALPISGTLPVQFVNTNGEFPVKLVGLPSATDRENPSFGVGSGTPRPVSISSSLLPSTDTGFVLSAPVFDSQGTTPLSARVNLSGATTFNIADLRTAVQIQKWLERNSRSGVRYTEFLRAHFAVSPRDDRLDRPEFIGSASMRVITSEVLQTSSTDSTSPQANMAGHGISVGGNYIGTYRVTEFGMLLGLMSIRPKPAYEDRLDRQWIKRTRYDFFFPEFQTLSEQGIYNAELRYKFNATTDSAIFGFQGRYSEMRFKHDLVCSQFRQSEPQNFSYWHMSRHWGIQEAVPAYNTLILYRGFNESSGAKRVLAVPSQPAFLVNFCNHLRAARPIPYDADPGYLDHY